MADGTPSAVMPLREEPPVTVPGRMSADAWCVPTGSALNGCRTCAHDYHPVTPCGRPVPEPVWRAHARAASGSALLWLGLLNGKTAAGLARGTAASVCGEDDARRAFRRDAAAERKPVTVPEQPVQVPEEEPVPA